MQERKSRTTVTSMIEIPFTGQLLVLITPRGREYEENPLEQLDRWSVATSVYQSVEDVVKQEQSAALTGREIAMLSCPMPTPEVLEGYIKVMEGVIDEMDREAAVALN